MTKDTGSSPPLPSFKAQMQYAPMPSNFSPEAVTQMAGQLRGAGDLQAAFDLTDPFVREPFPDHGHLAAHAETLKAMDRMDEAVATYRQAVTQYPASPVALHNLAALLCDLSHFPQAEVEVRKALGKGLDAYQTWLVLARALQGVGKLDESEQAYRQVVRRAPRDPEAHRELAQLIWMRSGDVKAALATLDATLASSPDPGLLEVRSVVLSYAGDTPAAFAAITAAVVSYADNSAVRVAASHLASDMGRPEEAVEHAMAAVRAAPTSFWAGLALCSAFLGVGEAARAGVVAQALLQQQPLNQSVLAFQATAWRLLGDPRYHAVYDYDRLISTSTLDTPKGWSRLSDYLTDLAQVLDKAHIFRAHPFQQSLENGTQIANLTSSADPVVQAFFEAVAGPIQRHLQGLGGGDDVVRRRNTYSSRFKGVWSVRLESGGGRHVDHVHPKGWLSSACYIDLPEAVSTSQSQEGWIKFGQPGVKTSPALEAERSIQPEPGLLVLFPSYMWHGTTPFTGAGRRLTIAFDLVPS